MNSTSESKIQPARWQLPTLDLKSQIAIALSLVCLNATPLLAQTKPAVPLHTLTVSGRGIERIPTTLTDVSLGVEVQGKTAQEVQQRVAQRSSSVVTYLRSRHVQKLQTTGISLNPTYDYNNNVQRLIGYTGTNTVSFRFNTETTGTLLDEAVKAGASRIDGISFVASDDAISTAQKQALRKATQDAQNQAEAVLDALRLTPKEVVSIQIDGASTPPPAPVAREALALAPGKLAETPVVGGEQEVEASVTLQIGY